MNRFFVLLLICLFGILKEFRPATPYLTPFLLVSKNLTDVQLYSLVYPYWTYSYALFLIPVFFFTDLLRYKPIMIMEALSLCGTWIILVWGQGLFEMQLMQITFGMASACEVAYYSYLYAVVDPKHFLRISAMLKVAVLTGKALGYALAQISLVAVSSVLIVALLLPSIPNRRGDEQSKSQIGEGEAMVIEKGNKESMELVIEEENPSALHPESTPSIGLKSHLTGMGGQLRVLFNNEEVRRWSIWWAMATCGINQVYNYMQTLWADIAPTGQWDNGWAELVNTVIGALVAFTVQYLHIDWTRYTSILLVSMSMLISILLLTVSQLKNLYMAYVLYVIVCSVYYLLITSARARIASHLFDSSSFGLVFGWNTLMALGLGTVMTMIVADSRGLALNIRTQFVVYGGYFAVISVLFLVTGLLAAILNGRKRREASII